MGGLANCPPLNYVEQWVILVKFWSSDRIKVATSMQSYTESDSDQKREVERDANQVDQERCVIVEADTRVDPRTVMVKSVDALAAGVAMLCSLALDHFTGEAIKLKDCKKVYWGEKVKNKNKWVKYKNNPSTNSQVRMRHLTLSPTHPKAGTIITRLALTHLRAVAGSPLTQNLRSRGDLRCRSHQKSDATLKC